MAIFRKVHTSFWSDSFVSELDTDHKLFYIYLMTNERTRQCGVYEITKRQISFDLGYSIDKVSKLLAYFIKMGKIRFNEKTNELAIGNWLKYNSSTSPKVKSCIDKEFSLVKDTVLIEYVKSMDTQSQEEQEEEQEKEQDIKFDFKKSLLELNIDTKLVDEWIKVRKAKRAVNTETAFNRFVIEVNKSSATHNEAVKMCVEKSWAGFEADWYEKNKPQPKQQTTLYKKL
jgi:hypothetical protein